jgi:hypothetical protein
MKENIKTEVLKNMTLEEKIKIVERLYNSAYELRYAAIKSQFPGLSDEEINEKTKKYFLNAK